MEIRKTEQWAFGLADKERVYVALHPKQVRATVALALQDRMYAPAPDAETHIKKAKADLVKLVDKATKQETIDKYTRRYILHSLEGARFPRLQVRWKTHKAIHPGADIPMPIRLIIDSGGFFTNNAAAYIGNSLRPHSQAQWSYVRDSTDAVCRIEATPCSKEAILATGDITNHFPSAPIVDCRAAAKAVWSNLGLHLDC
ncbi:MAG: hypothetical protein GWP23_02560 [Synechococcales cyanobacterium H12SWP_bin.12]|nr:hypothetical protein [Synechococcales cyanobacterium H12SWP_bin.12]